MFYLTTHSTHFIYGYMASDMVKDYSDSKRETRCRHMGYSFRLAARVILYTPSHRQDNTYHGLCYTSCGALAVPRNNGNNGCWWDCNEITVHDFPIVNYRVRIRVRYIIRVNFELGLGLGFRVRVKDRVMV